MKRLHLCALTLTTWAAVSVVPARADSPPPPAVKLVDALIRQLDHAEFAKRQEADRQLRRLGLGVVPMLQCELQLRPPLEVMDRLEVIIKDLTRLRWFDDVAAAKKEAHRTGKPMLVLSTLGTEGGLGCLVAQVMQASTFADLEVIDLLQREFVLVWHDRLWDDWYNTTLEFEKQLPRYSSEQIRNYGEGRGVDNLRLFFCASDGSVVTSLRGFYNSPRFLKETRLALKMLDKQAQSKSSGLRNDLARIALTHRALEMARDREGLGLEANLPDRVLEKSLSESADLYGKPIQEFLHRAQAEVKDLSFG